jgi:hypothetical protein
MSNIEPNVNETISKLTLTPLDKDFVEAQYLMVYSAYVALVPKAPLLF